MGSAKPAPEKLLGRAAEDGQERRQQRILKLLALTFLPLFFQCLPVVRFLQLFNDALVSIIQGLWVERSHELA